MTAKTVKAPGCIFWTLTLVSGGLWLLTWPFLGRRWKCASCGHTWNIGTTPALPDGPALPTLQDLTPEGFEQWVAARYQAKGFTVQLTPTTGDGGVDIYAQRGGKLVVVQCKRYANPVGEPAVRDLIGTVVINKAVRGDLVTTSTFTPAATKAAADQPIRLISAALLQSFDPAAGL